MQTVNWLQRIIFIGFVGLVTQLAGCQSMPENIQNICDMFADDEDWYDAALDAESKWGVPVHVSMAIMHQESKFQAEALPPRSRILWVIPGPRISSAYGYAQALDNTWRDYQRSTGNDGAERDEFEDAMDFIGWYISGTHKRLKISKWDAERQYLAYHEGRGGYAAKTYRKKPWLQKVARKVKRRASSYRAQYKRCETELADLHDGWF